MTRIVPARRRLTSPVVLCVVLAAFLPACRSCAKSDAPNESPSPGPSAVAEGLPRCHGEAEQLSLPGDDVVVGDVAIGPRGLLVGLIRSDRGKKVASVLEAPLDLVSSKMVDIGTAFGDDPPPSPRFKGDVPIAVFYTRAPSDGGAKLRELRIARIEGGAAKNEATIAQQADESTAFDVAFAESGAGLVAWDEDAPPQADAGPARDTYAPEGRGFVKVQVLGSETRRVASPESSDAESPRLRARPGGYWLAWLARRAENEGYEIESPGEKRAFRWVEAVPLGLAGEPAGPVRRVSSDKGRAVSFDLDGTGPELVVLVQDEAAASEAAGSRVTRYRVSEHVDGADVVDAGVGSTMAELVPVASPSATVRWLAWSDTSEHARVTPLDPLAGGFVAAGPSTLEPGFEGGRVLAAASAESVFALVPPAPSGQVGGSQSAVKIRRFSCSSKDVADAGHPR